MKKPLLIYSLFLMVSLISGITSPSFRVLGTAGTFDDQADLFILNPAYMEEFENTEIYTNFFNDSGSLSLGFLGLKLSSKSKLAVYVNASDQYSSYNGLGESLSSASTYSVTQTESDTESEVENIHLILGYSREFTSNLDAGIMISFARGDLETESDGLENALNQTTTDTYITTALEILEENSINSSDLGCKIGLSSDSGSGLSLEFSYSNYEVKSESFRTQNIVLRDTTGLPLAAAAYAGEGEGSLQHKVPELKFSFRKNQNYLERLVLLFSGSFAYTFSNMSDYEEEGETVEQKSLNDTMATAWITESTEDHSGNFMIAASVRGQYELSDKVRLGASLFYSFDQAAKSVGIYDEHTIAYFEHNDGDAETNDPDDYTGTYTKTVYEKSETSTNIHNVYLPFGLEIDLSEKVTLRAGTLHNVIWNNTHTLISPDDSYVSETVDVEYGDSTETSDSGYSTKEYDVENNQMYRNTYIYFGFLWLPAENVKFEINLRGMGLDFDEAGADFSLSLIF